MGRLPDWHLHLLVALTSAAYEPASPLTGSSGLDWLCRVTWRYRQLFGAPILASIEGMVEVFCGN